jgi:hypothetical protein
LIAAFLIVRSLFELVFFEAVAVFLFFFFAEVALLATFRLTTAFFVTFFRAAFFVGLFLVLPTLRALFLATFFLAAVFRIVFFVERFFAPLAFRVRFRATFFLAAFLATFLAGEARRVDVLAAAFLRDAFRTVFFLLFLTARSLRQGGDWGGLPVGPPVFRDYGCVNSATDVEISRQPNKPGLQ